MTSLTKNPHPPTKKFFSSAIQKSGWSVWAIEQLSSAIGGRAMVLVRQPKTAVLGRNLGTNISYAGSQSVGFSVQMQSSQMCSKIVMLLKVDVSNLRNMEWSAVYFYIANKIIFLCDYIVCCNQFMRFSSIGYFLKATVATFHFAVFCLWLIFCTVCIINDVSLDHWRC